MVGDGRKVFWSSDGLRCVLITNRHGNEKMYRVAVFDRHRPVYAEQVVDLDEGSAVAEQLRRVFVRPSGDSL